MYRRVLRADVLCWRLWAPEQLGGQQKKHLGVPGFEYFNHGVRKKTSAADRPNSGKARASSLPARERRREIYVCALLRKEIDRCLGSQPA